MASATERTIKRSFGRCFDLFTPKQKVFACVGEISTVAAEVGVLGNTFGWEEESSLTNATGIFLSIPTDEADTIDEIAATAPNAAFVFLGGDRGTKKNTLLQGLERQGYRILFERGNVTYLMNRRTEIDVLKRGLSLGDKEVTDFLRQSRRQAPNLPKDTPVDLISVEASDLLTSRRFDIAIKALYGRLWKEKRAETFRNFAYYEQALRITGPGEQIDEYDGTGKSGLDQFRTAFHRLICPLDPGDVPAVPISESWTAFDGAHRIAAAIVMKRRAHAARFSASSRNLADAVFFKSSSHGHPQCPTEILDEAAIEYCRVKKGLALVLIFPAVASDKFAIETLSSAAQIVYQNSFALSPEAGGALLRQAYLGHAWLQEEGESSGFAFKLKGCFPFAGTVRAVLVDGCEPSELRTIKDKIRLHYGIGNHSIHFTDGDDEVLRVARVVFNQNSLDLLRMGIGGQSRFHQMLFAYRDWLEENSLDEEAFCIDGSAILALLGLRECRDLDFLYHGDADALPALPEKTDCHNDVAHYHSHAISDLVGDPRLHCWYMGVKFCTARVVAESKQRRGEPKDRIDVALLQSRLLTNSPRVLKKLLVHSARTKSYFRARVRGLIEKLKKSLRPFVHAVRRRWP